MATPIKTVNTTEAAAMLGIQTRTFRRLCEREGITPVSYKANEVLYRRAEVTALVRKQSRAAAASSSRSTVTTSSDSSLSAN